MLAITTVRKVVPELISLGLVVVLVAPGLHGYYVTDVKEQWREVATHVEENCEENDAIVFAPDTAGWECKSFHWYYRGNLPGCGVRRDLRDDDEAIADALARCTSGSRRFWLIMRGPPKAIEPFRAFFLNRDNEAMSLIERRDFTSISVYLFEMTRW